MAGHKGHEFVWVKNVDHQLRHEADSDELRAVAEESAEGLREHFYWQKSRKPEAGQYTLSLHDALPIDRKSVV